MHLYATESGAQTRWSFTGEDFFLKKKKKKQEKREVTNNPRVGEKKSEDWGSEELNSYDLP